ncbi:MAG: YigZ family protein [Prolixibacteraceae bacterium]|nr:YigZ family protein [Prolixibacteraceae bacterium]
MEKDTYQSIESKCEGLFKDKGSKFLAFAYPVGNEEEVKAIVQELKKEHYSARHHCYAYRLGCLGEQYRANDDGEPSGTAGRPILGQLLSHELTNILVVVVRYFGGTLLGVSGLINAYKHAAANALEQATVVEHLITNRYRLSFDYPLQNQVMRVIKEDELNIVQSEFGLNCQLIVDIRLQKETPVLAKFEKIEFLKIELLTKMFKKLS